MHSPHVLQAFVHHVPGVCFMWLTHYTNIRCTMMLLSSLGCQPFLPVPFVVSQLELCPTVKDTALFSLSLNSPAWSRTSVMSQNLWPLIVTRTKLVRLSCRAMTSQSMFFHVYKDGHILPGPGHEYHLFTYISPNFKMHGWLCLCCLWENTWIIQIFPLYIWMPTR